MFKKKVILFILLINNQIIKPMQDLDTDYQKQVYFRFTAPEKIILIPRINHCAWASGFICTFVSLSFLYALISYHIQKYNSQIQ